MRQRYRRPSPSQIVHQREEAHCSGDTIVIDHTSEALSLLLY
jgi:hypothetical protein